MAIDSERKRRSALSAGQIFIPTSVLADGSIAQGDRQHAGWGYAGVSAELDAGKFYLNGVILQRGLYEIGRYEVAVAEHYRRGSGQDLITNDPGAGTRRYGWRLGWRAMPQADRDTLRTLYSTAGDLAWIIGDTLQSFTVQIMRDSWREMQVNLGDNGIYYDLGFTVEEV